MNSVGNNKHYKEGDNDDEMMIPQAIARQCQRLRNNDPGLMKLNLCHVHIGDDETPVGSVAICEHLGNGIRNNTVLQELFLLDNDIRRNGYISIFKAIKYNTSISTLLLGGNHMNDDSATSLADALRYNRTIQELWIVNEDVGESSITKIFHGGIGMNTSIRSLHINLMDISSSNNDACWRALGGALAKNATLRILDLGKNNIGCYSLMSILQYHDGGLRHNTTLQTINLRRNNISTNGSSALGSILKLSNCSLRDINLFGNKIDCIGMTYIVEGLKHNTSLVKLDLSHNKIGNRGSIALGSLLAGTTKTNNNECCCCCLQELYLMSNNIGSIGAKEIANGLKTNDNLLCLELNSNKIGTTGILSLLDAVETSNKTITWLSLNNQKPNNNDNDDDKNDDGNNNSDNIDEFAQTTNTCKKDITIDTTSDSAIVERISFYTRLNEVGRKYLDRGVDTNSIPTSLFPQILHRASYEPDLLQYILLMKPDLFIVK